MLLCDETFWGSATHDLGSFFCLTPTFCVQQNVAIGEEDLSQMFLLEEHGMAGGGDSMMALKSISQMRSLPEGVDRSHSVKQNISIKSASTRSE